MKKVKKILIHALQILLGGLIVAAFACVNLNDYFIFHLSDYIFWPLCGLLMIIALFCCWRHKACFLLGLLLLTSPAFAGEFTTEICNYYKSYEARIKQYKENHFQQDEACDENIWGKARQEAAEYEVSLTDVATAGVTAAVKKISKWYDGSCANDLMSLCSEYEERHPETVTKTVPVILNEPVGKRDSNGKATSCWPCDMAYVVFFVIQGMSSNLSAMMSSVALLLLMFGTAFWLLYKAAGMVLTSKGGTYFSQIASGLIGVIIAACFLRNGGENLSWLYSKFLSPVMELGIVIAEEIQTSVGMDSPAFSSMTNASQPFHKRLETRSASQITNRTDFTDYCGYSSSSSSSGSVADIFSGWVSQLAGSAFPTLNTNFSSLMTQVSNNQNTLLTDELRSRFLCVTQRFYNQSRPFIATGQSLISFASHNTKGFLRAVTRFPSNMKMWFFGVLLVCVFTYFGFLVAFRIIDMFLRLGFVLVLMPLFVAAVVFPITREYAVKAWNFLFQIIVEFIGLSISISFVMILLEGVIMPESDELLNAMTAPYSEEYGENLYNAITKDMTWSFLLYLICAVIMGEQLLKFFPNVISKIFNVAGGGVKPGDMKGKASTTMGQALQGAAGSIYGGFQRAKGAAGEISKNPYKTKETKAQNAEKDLNDKQRKLTEEKKKLADSQKEVARLKGTPQEKAAAKKVEENKKNVDKAQKDVDEAKKVADAARAEADAEQKKTAPSQSRYAARRFGYDSGNAMRKGGGKAAEVVEKFGSKVGGFLMKNGVGAVAGVPLVLGAKTVSAGIRLGAKTAEIGLKAAGRLGATGQKMGYKFTGKAPPPRKPKP